MNAPNLLVAFLCGGLFSGLIVFLWARSRLARESSARDAEIAKLTERSTQLDSSLSLREAALNELRASLTQCQGQLAVAQTTLAKEREANSDKLKFLEQTRDEMSLRFKQLSQEILEDKAKRFTEQNQLNLEQILKPLREKISGFEQQVKETYEKENRVRIELVQQITHLQKLNQQVSEDTKNLTTALKGEAKTRGNWGEMILERILEISGLEKDREYETQFSARHEGERQRYQPDVVVHLPDSRDIIIDAKVSLNAHARLVGATDEPARKLALAEHVQAVRTHIRELSAKNYQALEGIQTLDFIFMFVPNEAAYIEAIREAPELLEEALGQHIGLVAPSTLLATLRTVEYLWKIERQNRNAQKIAEAAGGLYDQLVLFEEALSDVGDKLGKAQKSYDLAYARLSDGRGNLVRRAEQIKKMGAAASKQLPESLRQAAEDQNEALDAGAESPKALQ